MSTKLAFPTSLPEFMKLFPDDAACAAYLESVRWPDDFVCHGCSWQVEPNRFANRSSIVLRYRNCKRDTSLTAGTVMQRTHTPMSIWFWAAYLVSSQTPGMSAVQFQRQLGLKRYETAFQTLHKLRTAMVRPDRDRIGGNFPVKVDETWVGGRTRGADSTTRRWSWARSRSASAKRTRQSGIRARRSRVGVVSMLDVCACTSHQIAPQNHWRDLYLSRCNQARTSRPMTGRATLNSRRRVTG